MFGLNIGRTRQTWFVAVNSMQKQDEILTCVRKSDLQNHLWGLTLNDKLFLAPIESKHLQHVLDMGCGTGIWTINFGKTFLQSDV